jgi:hypothetical protein
VKLVAGRAGQQRILQPVWTESDKRFGRDDTLLTTAFGHNRRSNERAVNVYKRAWFISRGFHVNSCPKRLTDVWLM